LGAWTLRDADERIQSKQATQNFRFAFEFHLDLAK
jgi:hypothetical protein